MSAEGVRARIARHLGGRTGPAALPAVPEPPRGIEMGSRGSAFDPGHRHGDWRLEEALGADPDVLALLAKDPGLASIDLGGALYLDTETSGLSGGAGTWVFLVGLGCFRERGFELWQGFLAEPAEEPELLAETARRIRDAGAVVSFFGKAFDRHRLEDKMRVHGIEPPFDAVLHLDLYHPLRRVYAGAFTDTKLRTLERELCCVAREDDLPGSRAPAAWFDYLAGRRHELEGVFRHNRDDVLSLVTLAAHLARTAEERRGDGTVLAGPDSARALALGRAYAEAREPERAVAWYERAVERCAGALPEAHALRLERARGRVRRAQRAPPR